MNMRRRARVLQPAAPPGACPGGLFQSSANGRVCAQLGCAARTQIGRHKCRVCVQAKQAAPNLAQRGQFGVQRLPCASIQL